MNARCGFISHLGPFVARYLALKEALGASTVTSVPLLPTSTGFSLPSRRQVTISPLRHSPNGVPPSPT